MVRSCLLELGKDIGLRGSRKSDHRMRCSRAVDLLYTRMGLRYRDIAGLVQRTPFASHKGAGYTYPVVNKHINFMSKKIKRKLGLPFQ